MKCSSQVWIVALLALNTSGLAWGAKCPQPYFNGFGNSGAPVALASDPILATNDDGHLEVFGLGKDGAVWHSWQDSHSGTWSAWVPFPNPPGVSFPSLLTASGAEGEVTYPQLAVAKDFQGRLQLFIVDGSTVWQVGQVKKNVNWNSWQKLTLGISGSPVGVWATPNADGHPELFIFNRFNGKLVHFWQFNGQTNWLGPAEFDLPSAAGTLNVNMSIAFDANADITVAAVGSDSNVYIRRQQSPSSGWGEWQSAGKPSGVQLQQGTAWIAPNNDKRLEVMATDSTGTYWHTWEVSPGQLSGTWSNFGNSNAFPGFDSQLVQSKGGCLTGLAQVRVDNGTSDRTINVTQKYPSSDWNGWSGSLLGNFQRATGHMAVARDNRGSIVVFMRGIDGGALREISNYP